MKEIFYRRSIRKYTDKPVEEEKVDKILRAAMQAPSAGNQRPWEFIIVDDKYLLNKLADTSPFSRPVQKAPLAIVVLGNQKRMMFPENWQMDLSVAIENMLLEAIHLGLGGVWLGVAPLDKRIEHICQVFKLPPYIQPFAIVPIGYPAEEAKFINRFEKKRIHHNKY